LQSVPITTKVVSSNPIHDDVYSIQHYVIKFISDLWQDGGFLWVLQFHPTRKRSSRYNWNIIERGVNNHKANEIKQA
jgi:hypothetical protein